MASELRGLAWTSVLVPMCMTYARFACSRLRPGPPRLAALLPVFPVLIYLPFLFTSLHLRVFSVFFHAWLAVNKLVLLALAFGPLHPSLPLLQFIFCAGLPIKLSLSNRKPKSPVTEFFIPCLLNILLLTAIASLYPYTAGLHPSILRLLYCIHVFLTLDLVLAFLAFVSIVILQTDLERQFKMPFAVMSLSDFWGRQWNLMAADILRLSAYEPVRVRWGRDLGVLSTFLMSGLLHEVLYWYLTLQPPTGEMIMFFVLHGVFHIVERWARIGGVWRPPTAVAYFLSSTFIIVTVSALFFAPFLRAGIDLRLLQESAAVLEFFEESGKVVLGQFGMLSNSI